MIIIPEYLPLEATGRGRSGGISSFRGNSDDDKSKLFRRREEPTEVVEEGIPDAGLGSMSNPELFSLVPRGLINVGEPEEEDAERTQGFPINPDILAYLDRVKKRQMDLYGPDPSTASDTASEKLILDRISPDDLDMSALEKMITFESEKDENDLIKAAARDARLDNMDKKDLPVEDGEGDGTKVQPEDGEGDGTGTNEDDLINAASDDDVSEKDRASIIDSYAKEYLELAPDREGKTGRDKAFERMNLGLNIMLENTKSQNAIEGTIKAWNRTAEKLAKDKEQARAYKQALNLSAFKYAVQKTDALETEGRVENRYTYIGDKPFEFDGRTYNKNDSIILTKDDRENSKLPLEKMLLESDFLAQLQTLTTARRTALTAATINTPKKAGEFSESVGTYNLLLKDLETNASLFALANGMRDAVGDGDVTGIKPLIGKYVNKVYAALQIKLPAAKEGGFEKYKERVGLTDDARTDADTYFSFDTDGDGKLNAGEISAAKDSLGDKYAGIGQRARRYQDQAQVVANLMIKEILGEGSKNVSNIDRQLASEIVGLLTDMNAVGADPELLKERIGRIINRAEMGYESNLSQIQAWEKGNLGTMYVGGQPVLADIYPRRQQVFEDIAAMQPTKGRSGKRDTALGQGIQTALEEVAGAAVTPEQFGLMLDPGTGNYVLAPTGGT
jgi:hypothetical protein